MQRNEKKQVRIAMWKVLKSAKKMIREIRENFTLH